MATNFTPVGNEIQINLSPNQNDDQFDPDIATLTDGRFFVAFTDGDGGNDNIIGQFVNADGTLSGSNIDIELDINDQDEPAVAQRASGAAVVVWEDEDASNEIHYAIVSSGGSVGTEQTILDGDPLNNPDVATLADGRSIVVASQANIISEDIVFRFIDPGGAPSGVLDFVDNGANDQFDPAVAAFNNNALVVYEEDSATGITSIQARFFNGSSFATEFTVSNSDHDVFDPDVAALTDGRFIVVWGNDENDNVEARLVSATGVLLGEVLTIEGGFGNDPRVAALPNGGFVVTWTDFFINAPPEVDGNDGAVYARRFDANGDPAGDPFLVNAGDSDFDQDLPTVATNTTTGQTFIAWEDSLAFPGADNDPDGIRGHAFVTSLDTVNGTNGDDVITTYNIGEPINGLGGDDLINGSRRQRHHPWRCGLRSDQGRARQRPALRRRRRGPAQGRGRRRSTSRRSRPRRADRWHRQGHFRLQQDDRKPGRR